MQKNLKSWYFKAALLISLACATAVVYYYATKYERRYAKKPVHKLLQTTYSTFAIPRDGIIHIGARGAEELPIYKKHHIKDVLWIEADPAAEQKLLHKTANHLGSKIAMIAATDQNGIIDLHVTSNNGDSSSILKLKNHVLMSPDVIENKVVQVPQRRLDDYLQENVELKNIKYNVIVIDIQGAEMIALSGATATLQHIDAIIAEVNYDELYEGAAIITELDAFLMQRGFVRVDGMSANRFYGDALYIKKEFCVHQGRK